MQSLGFGISQILHHSLENDTWSIKADASVRRRENLSLNQNAKLVSKQNFSQNNFFQTDCFQTQNKKIV